MKTASGGFVATFLLRDLVQRVLTLPVWWYTIGLATMLKGMKNNIKQTVRGFGLDVWVKNLFVPMYGETQFSGKLISFGIRLVMVLAQSIGLFVWSLLLFVFFFIYLLSLPASVLGIFYYGFGLLFF